MATKDTTPSSGAESPEDQEDIVGGSDEEIVGLDDEELDDTEDDEDDDSDDAEDAGM
jgi:hypothetical protein